LASAYASADAFLLPSLYDPFANVTLEAMSAGLPVITTRDNGACEAIQPGQNGFVVSSAKETAEMSAMLITLKSDPALRERMGLAAQQTAREYSFQKNADATIALCEKARG
jgi:UDP-glucose:(heptosyl)LPS alpha-1,3-glucosyltransferase